MHDTMKNTYTFNFWSFWHERGHSRDTRTWLTRDTYVNRTWLLWLIERPLRATTKGFKIITLIKYVNRTWQACAVLINEHVTLRSCVLSFTQRSAFIKLICTSSLIVKCFSINKRMICVLTDLRSAFIQIICISILIVKCVSINKRTIGVKLSLLHTNRHLFQQKNRMHF